MRWRALAYATFLVVVGCKPKPQPDDTHASATTTTAAAASSSAPEPPASAQATVVVDAATVLDAGSAKSVTGEIRVSSRSEDPKSSPLAMFDGSDATFWSPAAGDAAPTIAFEIQRAKTNVHALLLTTSGVLELKVTWKARSDVKNEYGVVSRYSYGAEQMLAERVALDTTATGAERVAAETTGNGIVTITILKAVSGATPVVRELQLETDNGTVLRPMEVVVGDGKPRGISGIVPEQRLELECVAAVNDPPRAYCFSGAWVNVASLARRAAFVMIDASGTHALRSLTFDYLPELIRDSPMPHLRWEDWLAVEKTLRDAGATTLEKRRGSTFPAGAIEVPWGKTASAFGATLRQRETSAMNDDFAPGLMGGKVRSGVLEVQWPGAAGFTNVIGDVDGSLGGAWAFARPLGTAWLLERQGVRERTSGGNGRETVSENEASAFGDAILCDPTTKKCTTTYSSGP
jgi:hypothetical protein